MYPENFAEFLRRQGHHVVATETCYWYDAQSLFFFYFPYHRLITPSDNELQDLFRKERCIGLRFFSPMSSYGKESYLVVCANKNYDICSVAAGSSRNETRRGLERFEIKQVDFAALALQGQRANQDTLARQGRNPAIWNEGRWQKYCRSAEGLDGFEAWGAFADQVLASFLVGFQMEDHFTILHQSSVTEYLCRFPNNALVFAVTKLKLALPEVNAVSYGPESLDAPGSLDAFKFRMGYERWPMKQRIVFNPIIQPFIGNTFHKCVRIAAAAMPASDTFRKLEGIIRFHREAVPCPGVKEQEMRARDSQTDCQLSSVPILATGPQESFHRGLKFSIRRVLGPGRARMVEKSMNAYKNLLARARGQQERPAAVLQPSQPPLDTGDRVRIRSAGEIQLTLDHFSRLKGCSFAPEMREYCGTIQRVLKPVRRFADERDMTIRNTRGIVILENITCKGTAAFGPCDRNCFLFWREEWLERCN